MERIEADSTDLEAFARERDEEAFARLVRRYADLVYAACLRQVREPSLAEDAAQTVFVLLAQRAGNVGRSGHVAGWLYNVARHASRNVLRGERRRKRREKEAAMLGRDSKDPVGQRELEEVVDQAMSRLRASDREALLLRFFKGQSHEEIGRQSDSQRPRARRQFLEATRRRDRRRWP